jgi:hypothetical protein
VKIRISRSADRDLLAGFRFYERQARGVGHYFLDSLFADIDSLVLRAGIHRKIEGFYRLLSDRFPFAIYYKIEDDVVRIRPEQRPRLALRRQSRLGCQARSWLIFNVRQYSRAVEMTTSDSMRVRGLAGTIDESGKNFCLGGRETAEVVTDRDRGFSRAINGVGRHAYEPLFSVKPARTFARYEDHSAALALGTIRSGLLPGHIEALFAQRIGPPNKTPEPTTTAVTPRALASFRSLPSPAHARGVPAAVVAHL